MKKIAIVLSLLMVIGAVPSWAAMSATVDGYLDRRAESDIRPLSDAAKLTRHSLGLAEKTLEHADPVLRHRTRITDPIMRGAKYIVNTPYDMLMRLNPFRDRGEK